MAVSRRGKRGTRAGHMIPESRNRRVKRNAGLKNITKENDLRPTGKRITKEQWVINTVTRIVGTYAGPGFINADDTASDVLLALLDAGGFQWEEDEIVSFCRKKATFMVRQYLRRKEKCECEFDFDDGTGRIASIFEIVSRQSPDQDTIVQARLSQGLLWAIPDRHRQAIEILADGGNPIHVADELDITPWEAIAVIKEARDYMDRVDPLSAPRGST